MQRPKFWNSSNNLPAAANHVHTNVPACMMDGDAIQSGGSFITTDQSPLKGDRAAGMSPAAGAGHYMGNTRYDDEDRPDQTDFASRANLLDLSRYLKTSPYPRDTSDAVALMVFAHQQRLHNLITSTNYFVRTCLFDADVQLKRPGPFTAENPRNDRDADQRRLRNSRQGNPLLRRISVGRNNKRHVGIRRGIFHERSEGSPWAPPFAISTCRTGYSNIRAVI